MSQNKDYHAFLLAKHPLATETGIPCDQSTIHPLLKPHQRALVAWAVCGGRRAIFAAFGLGKTLMQLEIVRLTLKHTGGRGLIVLPLGVRQEFVRDGAMIGLVPRFIRGIKEADEEGIYLTNYETVRDGKLDPRGFSVVSLDEAGVLRGFGGTKTFRELMRLYEGTASYRFVATATPDPNEYIELLAYAAFLDIMDVGQAKTRFFKRDSTKADALTLHPHKEKEFWLWVASWAAFVQRPSDLGPGFSDDGYVLPAMTVNWHEVSTDHKRAGEEHDGQIRLLHMTAYGVSEAAREKRESLSMRLAKLKEIILNGRRTESLSEGILREEQGEASPTSESPLEIELPEKSRNVQNQIKALEATESRQIQRGQPPPCAQQQRENNCSQSGMVYEQQGSCERDKSKEQIAEVWTDDGRVLSSDGEATRPVRDLSGRDDPACSGSRSYNRQNKRSSLSWLQCGTWALPRECDASSKGGTIHQQFIVWCHLNSEQRAIEIVLNDLGISFSSLYGTTPIDDREAQLETWRQGETIAFVSKPVMYGAGVNLQQCNHAIFIGIGFKFCEFVQALARIHRFLQDRPVKIDLIYTEAERSIREVLEAKWERYREQSKSMSSLIRTHGLANIAAAQELQRTIGVIRQEVSGDGYRLILNDCVEELPSLADDSIDFILTSIPFATQYEYTPSYNDFGHTDDHMHFWQQMDFLTPHLKRVLKPGRVMAIHVKDRIIPSGLTGLGFQTVAPLHAEAIAHYQRHWFAYLGMKTIVTDVVRENNQTYRLGWTEQCKDGSRMGCGMPEYVLLFRKPPTDRSNGYADVPVVKSKEEYRLSRWQIDANGFQRSDGNRLLTAEEMKSLPHAEIYKRWRDFILEHTYDYEQHVALGEAMEQARRLPVTFNLLPPHSWHPDVWTDIARMRTLNMLQERKGQQMHLCPLQFDIVDRLILQFTMKDEIILDPFAGLMTVPYCAVKLGRRAIGIELNAGYFADGVNYVQAAASQIESPTLFDITGIR